MSSSSMSVTFLLPTLLQNASNENGCSQKRPRFAARRVDTSTPATSNKKARKNDENTPCNQKDRMRPQLTRGCVGRWRPRFHTPIITTGDCSHLPCFPEATISSVNTPAFVVMGIRRCHTYEDLNLVPIVMGGFRTFCY